MTHHDTRQAERLVSEYMEGGMSRRRFLQRAGALGLASSTLAALLAACGGGQKQAATSTGQAESGATATSTSAGGGSTLRIRTYDADLSSLDNASWVSPTDQVIMQSVYEGLVTYKPGTSDVVNALAESFQSSPDGLRHDFVLKKGIQFHGGYGELTADDVKFTYERIAGLTKPKVTSGYAGDWATLQEVQVTGSHSGTIVLKASFAPLLTTTLPLNSGLVLSQKAVTERGKKYPTHPIGTGPYEFTNWTPKQRITLTRFAEYGGAASAYAAPAQWDEIRLFPIPDDAAAEIALETGEVDFGAIPSSGVQRFEANSKFTLNKVAEVGYAWIGMNLKDPALQDVNLRQAIRYAVDVPSILVAAYDNLWQQAYAMLPPGEPLGFWADAPHYDRDTDKAKEFLSKVANPPELRFTVADEPGAKPLAEIVQSNLRDIGLKINIETLDTTTFYTISKQASSRQLFYAVYGGLLPDPSWATVWEVCDQVGQWNWMNWCDQTYSKLHDEAINETDPDKRTAMYIEMQKLIDQNVHDVFVAYPTRAYAARTGLTPAMTPWGLYVPWAFRSA
jgi:peptide/nickel transport system substrate-binding protein